MKALLFRTICLFAGICCMLAADANAGTLEFDGVPVDITTSTGEDLVIVPGTGGNVQIGDASDDNVNATANDDLHVTGVIESDGIVYSDSGIISGSNVIPDTSKSHALGTDTYEWNELYVRTIYSSSSDDLTIDSGSGTIEIIDDIIDMSAQKVDVELNESVDALNIASSTLSVDALNARIGIGTAAPDSPLHIYEGGATAASVVDMVTITKETSGTAAAGIGAGLAFDIEDAGGTEEQASVDVVMTNVSEGAEDADIVFTQNVSGALQQTVRVIAEDGTLQVGADGMSGDLKLYSEQGAADFTTSFSPSAAQTESYTLTFPVDSGDVDQGLRQTDGNGTLVWVDLAQGNVIADDDMDDNAIIRGDGGVTGVQDSGIFIDDTDNITGVQILSAEHYVSSDDADINDELVVGNLVIDEAVGTIAFTGVTSTTITSAASTISFDDENLTTTGILQAETIEQTKIGGTTPADATFSIVNAQGIMGTRIGVYSPEDATFTNVRIGSGSVDYATDTDALYVTGNLEVDGSSWLGDASIDNITITGTLTQDAPLTITSATMPQLSVRYDASNYETTTVTTAGEINRDATGANASFGFMDNVGIGITNPSERLVVYSATDPTIQIKNDGSAAPFNRLQFYRNGAAYADIFYDAAGSGTLQGLHFVDYRADGTAGFTFGVGGNNTNVRINADGNVGIGVSDPDQRLEVVGTMRATHMEDTNIGQTTPADATFTQLQGKIGTVTAMDATFTHLQSYIGNITPSEATFTHIQVGTTGSVDYATGDDAVYITGNLEVDGSTWLGDAAVDNITINGTLSQNAPFSVISTTAPQFTAGYDASNYWQTSVSDAGNVEWNAVGGSAAFGVMDNLGIGTTSPVANLHLKSATAGSFYDDFAETILEGADSRLHIMSTDGGNNGSALMLTNNSKSWILHQQTAVGGANRLDLGYRQSGANEDIVNTMANLVTFKTDGNVGIGVIAPEKKLHVAGTLTATDATFSRIDVARIGAISPNDATFTDIRGRIGSATAHDGTFTKIQVGTGSIDYATGTDAVYVTGNLEVDGNTWLGDAAVDNIVIQGSLSHTGPISVISTSAPQLTVGYDGSNYWENTISNAGAITLDATGGSAAFGFLDNVGIGTTTPVTTMVVYTGATNTANGLTLLQGGTNSARLFFTDASDGDSFALYKMNTNLVFSNAATSAASSGNTAMVLTSGSNVGIGVIAPEHKLHVAGTLTATDATFERINNARIGGISPNDATFTDIRGRIGSATAHDATFTKIQVGTGSIDYATGTDAVYVTGNLEVDGSTWLGDAAVDNITIQGSLSHTGPISIISTQQPQHTVGYDGSNYMETTVYDDGATEFDITGTDAEFSFLDNVGIGTTEPGANLDVEGSQVRIGSGETIMLQLSGGGTGSSIRSLQTAVDNTSQLTLNGDPLLFQIATVEKMRVDTSGNVGILAKSPEHTLHVAGTLTATDATFERINNARIGGISPNDATFTDIKGRIGSAAASDATFTKIQVGTGSIDYATGTDAVYVTGNLEVDGSTWLGDAAIDNITINGTLSQNAPFTVVSTTQPQLTIAYDGSNDWRTSISSAGAVEMNALGASAAFGFMDNVGIGTTAPHDVFDVQTGSTSNDVNIIFEEIGADQQRITFQEANLDYFGIYHDGFSGSPSNKLKVMAADSSDGTLDVTAITVMQNGNIGMGGVGSPEKTLHVAGTLTATDATFERIDNARIGGISPNDATFTHIQTHIGNITPADATFTGIHVGTTSIDHSHSADSVYVAGNLEVDGSVWLGDTAVDNITIAGTMSQNSPFSVISTNAPQLTVGYDNSNIWETSVTNAGAVTFDATGASAGFTVTDDLTSNADVTIGDASTDSLTVNSMATFTNVNVSIETPAGGFLEIAEDLTGGDEVGTLRLGRSATDGWESIKFDPTLGSKGKFRFSAPLQVAASSPAITFYDPTDPGNAAKQSSIEYSPDDLQVKIGDAIQTNFAAGTGDPPANKTFVQIGPTALNAPHASGIFIGTNAPGAFVGDLMHLQVGGNTRFRITRHGDIISGGATMTTNAPLLNQTQTWNSGGATFEAWLLNVTDTASAAASKLMSLRVDGVPKFTVRKDGRAYTAGNIGIGDSDPQEALIVVGNMSAQMATFTQMQGKIGNVTAHDATFTRLQGAIGSVTPADATFTKIQVGTGSMDYATSADAVYITGNLEVDGSTWLGDAAIDNITINGTLSQNAPFSVISTTQPQLTIAYDGSNKWQTSVSSAGAIQMDAVGVSAAFGLMDNVGIGTTAPLGQLHLFTQSSGSYLDSIAEAFIEGDDGRLQIMASDNGSNGAGLMITNNSKSWGIHQKTLAGGANRLDIGYRASGASEDILEAQSPKMTFLTGGNIGIGTVTPIEKLQVAGSITATTATFDSINVAIIGNSVPADATFTTMRASSIEATSIGGYSPADASFTNIQIGAGTVDYALGSDSLYVTGNMEVDGNVWLGDAAVDNITIAGTLTQNAPFTVTSTTVPQLTVAYDGSNYLQTSVYADGGTTLNITGTDAEFGFLDNVGVGISEPTTRLHINTDSADQFGLRLEAEDPRDTGIVMGRDAVNGAAISMRTSTKDYLGINVNGASTPLFTDTAQMVITEDGDIGVGVLLPEKKLHVAGTLTATDATFVSINEANIGNSVPKDATFTAIHTTVGNAGIGTTQPTAYLHVRKDGTNDPIALFGGTGSNGISVTNGTGQATLFTAASGDAFITDTVAGDTGLRYAQKFFFGDGTNPDVVFSAAGNVGIGVTDPDQKLEVIGLVKAEKIQITKNYYGKDAALVAYGNQGNSFGSNAVLTGHTSTHPAAFGATGSTAITFMTANAYFDSGGADSRSFDRGAVNYNSLLFGMEMTENNFFFKWEDNTSDSVDTPISTWQTRMHIEGDTGRVGIGTTEPTQLLHVNGTLTAGDSTFTQLQSRIGSVTAHDATFTKIQVGTGSMDHATGADGVYITGDLEVDGSTWLGDAAVDNITIQGSMTHTGGFSITSTTVPQLTVGYDGTNKLETSVASDGSVIMNASGVGAEFSFSDNVGIGITEPDATLAVYGTDGAIFTLDRSDLTGKTTFAIDSDGGNERLTVDFGTYFQLYEGGTTYFRLHGGTDGNSYIRLRDSAGVTNFQILAADGTPRLDVNSAGNVGIGTTTPAAPLQVAFAGIAQEGAATNVAGVSLGRSGNSPRISLDTGAGNANVAGNQWNIDNNAGVMRIFTAGSVKSVVTSVGNVGIGVTDPSQVLEVIGNIHVPRKNRIGGDYASISEVYSSAGAVFGSNAKADTADVNQMIIANTNATVGAQAVRMDYQRGIAFHAMAGSVTAGNAFSSERVRIDPDGNVGIGTTEPTQLLHVKGTVTALDATFTTLVASSIESTPMGFYAPADATFTNVHVGTTSIDFATTADSVYVAGDLEVDGNVWLGDTVADTLTIAGSMNQNSPFTITSTNQPQFKVRYNASNYWQSSVSSAGHISLEAAGASQAFGFLDNVGIGTTEPGADLDVHGDFMIGAADPFSIKKSAAKTIDFDMTNEGSSGHAFRIGLGGWGADYFSIENSIHDSVYHKLLANGDGFLNALGANLGIGAINPEKTLHVAGTLTATDATFVSINEAIIGNLTPKDASFTALAVDTNVLYADPNTNNVGIGTTAPVAALEVKGSIVGGDQGWVTSLFTNATGRMTLGAAGSNALLDIHDNTAVAADTGSLGVNFSGRVNDAGPAYGYFGRIQALKENATQGNIDSYMNFRTAKQGVGSNIERMRINSNGNVGIGTSDPQDLLEVRKDQAGVATKLIINNDGAVQAGTTSRLSFYEGTDERNYIERRKDGTGILAFVTLDATNDFVYYQSDGTTKILQIEGDGNVLVPNGNVGIGVSDPDKTFEVAGNMSANDATFDQIQTRIGTVTANDASFTTIIASNIAATPIGSYSPADATFTSIQLGTGSIDFAIAENDQYIAGDLEVDGTVYGNFVGNIAKIVSLDSEIEVVDAGDGYLEFIEDGDEKMRVTGGNVGIGTSTPTSQLVVTGTDDILARFGDGTGYSQINIGNQAASYNLQLGYNVSSPERGYIQAIGANESTPVKLSINPEGGNVGIGTVTPTHQLTIAGTLTATDATFNTLNNAQIGATTAAQATFTMVHVGTTSIDYATTADSVYVAGDLEVDGDVWLGDTVTDSLTIAGSFSQNSPLTITSTTLPQFVVAYDGSNKVSTSVSSDGLITINADGADPEIYFPDKVGIGIAEPELPLHVVSAGGHPAYFDSTYNTGGGSGAGIYLRNTVAGGAALGNARAIYFGFNDSGSVMRTTAKIQAITEGAAGAGSVPTGLRFSTGSATPTTQMAITNLGNVGIGIETPTHKLTIAGTLTATDATFASVNNARIGNVTPNDATFTALNVQGGVKHALTSKSGDYTATISDHIILVDASGGDVTITLPLAAEMTGRGYVFKRTDDTQPNDVIIDPNGAETIDDAATYIMKRRYQSYAVVSDGTEWWNV